MLLCSKFGIVRDFETGGSKCDSEASLERLGVDMIDLYYQHCIDKDTLIEEATKAMAELSQGGQGALYRSVRVEYSPWTLDTEEKGVLEATLNESSPSGRGMTTSTTKSLADMSPNDARRFYPRFHPDTFYKSLDIVTKIEALARYPKPIPPLDEKPGRSFSLPLSSPRYERRYKLEGVITREKEHALLRIGSTSCEVL
ncbi:hypothetical protein BX666DRAFT_2026051 [Dichotomocladium elegans]|nr:hypothetical protein BX666DRAFT_2026051 [Dichotomocladium elegans]